MKLFTKSKRAGVILTGSLLALSSILMAQDKKLNHAESLSAAISKPQPEYPPVARQLKVEGTVELNATVGEDGTVEKADVLSGNPILAKAAQETLKKWRFSKMTEDGKAVKFVANVAFTFKL
ncbi:MAG: energy transducer TonB [Ignavibacteriota bacterium]